MCIRLVVVQRVVLGLALCLAALPIQANDKFLVFNTVAVHFNAINERNDFTPGIGYEYSPTGKLGFHLGTVSDSFGYQAKYAGLNYGTRRVFKNRFRLILGATIVNKQFHMNSEPQTKILPLPALEMTLSRHSVLNISGSPKIDYAGQRNNPVVWFQYKLSL